MTTTSPVHPRILITGAGGMLAPELLVALEPRYRIEMTRRAQMDITDPASVEQVLSGEGYSWLINCAAMSDVDACETRRDEALSANGAAPLVLARACRRHRIRLLHISTDYVFSGLNRRPYREDDPAGEPANWYGASKLKGEEAVLSVFDVQEALIVRSQWLYGRFRESFVDRLVGNIRAGRGQIGEIDRHSCPSSARYVAEGIARLIDLDARGVVHVSCEGEATGFDFAEETIRFLDADVNLLTPRWHSDLRRAAVRPAYSVLCKDTYHRLTGQRLPYWRDALRTYLRARCSG